MDKIELLEKEIEKIKQRNLRVEKDKAWEISWTRRIFIATSTYILVVVFLLSISAEKPFVTAIVPAVAYFISTASMSIIKEWWLKSKRDSETSLE